MSDDSTDFREPHLPQWAKRILGSLRRRVVEQEREIAALKGEGGRSETTFIATREIDLARRLTPLVADTVVFKTANGEIHVNVDRDLCELYLYSPDGPLLIMPNSSNTCHMRVSR